MFIHCPPGVGTLLNSSIWVLILVDYSDQIYLFWSVHFNYETAVAVAPLSSLIQSLVGDTFGSLLWSRATWEQSVYDSLLCRWVQTMADYESSQRYQVSAEQQINSRLFAYVCCWRAESSDRSEVKCMELKLHSAAVQPSHSLLQRGFIPLNLSRTEKAGSSDLTGGSVRVIIWYHLGLSLREPHEFYSSCRRWMPGHVILARFLKEKRVTSLSRTWMRCFFVI